MKCQKCGFELVEGDKFCRGCGEMIEELQQQNQQEPINTPVNNQPVYNQQPVYNNTQYPNQMYMPPKKSNAGIIIAVIAVLGLLFVGIIVFVIISFASNSFTEEVEKVNKKTPTQTDKTQNTPSQNTPTTVVSDKTVVNFLNFEFKLPTNYEYLIEDDTLQIADAANPEWVVAINIAEGNFEAGKSNKTELYNHLRNNGIESSYPVEKTYSGVEYLLFELTANYENVLAGYTAGSPKHIFSIMIQSTRTDFDYDVLDEIAPIIKSAEYKKVQKNMEVPSKIDKIKTDRYFK